MTTKYAICLFPLLFILLIPSCQRKTPQQSQSAKSDFLKWRSWTEKAKSFQPVAGHYGGTLVVTSFGGDPKTFNPITHNETSSLEVLQFVFEGLVDDDVVNEGTRPALAKEWQVSGDHQIYDFNLREDVKWFDGRPLTADDVVFSFNELVYNKNIICAARDILTINGKKINVIKTGKYSVRMVLPFKFAPFLKMITGGSVPIVPRHLLQKSVKEKKFSSTWEVNTPVAEIVGTGPFMITKYEPAQRLILSRNPNYWKKDGQGNALPYLDKIIFLYCQDMSAELLKFKNSESDYYYMRGEDFPVLKPLEREGNFTIYNLGPPLGDVFLIFNQNTGINKNTGKPLVNPVKLKWFRNRRFRQAAAYCIDREAMINIVHNGLAQKQHSPVNEAAGIFHNPNLKKYDYNLDLAKRILREEGFIDRNEDGVLEDGEGNPVEFSLFTNAGNTDRKKYCEIIRKDLETIGMKVHFSLLEFNNLVDKLDHSYDWEAIVLGLTGSPDPHSGNNVWQSSGRTHQWFPYQKKPSTPWEARIDEIFNLAAQEMDLAKRKALYNEWQNIYAEELPYIILVSKFRLFAVRNRFGNVNPVPIAEGAYAHKKKFFHNIEEIFVKKEFLK
jgi:peptide/nickel transport system substrate-binding protein